MELTPIDFLAQLINNQKAKQEGYAASTRWLVTKEDLREECKAEAERIFEEWKTDELNAKESREEMDNRIKYFDGSHL